jgi:hypothetical protein
MSSSLRLIGSPLTFIPRGQAGQRARRVITHPGRFYATKSVSGMLEVSLSLVRVTTVMINGIALGGISQG